MSDPGEQRNNKYTLKWNIEIGSHKILDDWTQIDRTFCGLNINGNNKITVTKYQPVSYYVTAIGFRGEGMVVDMGEYAWPFFDTSE